MSKGWPRRDRKYMPGAHHFPAHFKEVHPRELHAAQTRMPDIDGMAPPIRLHDVSEEDLRVITDYANAEKGKGKKRITYNVYGVCPDGSHEYPASGGGAPTSTPGHEAAEACLDADMDKGAIGNPVRTGYQDQRLSEPITAGHAAYSASGDHNLGAGRNPGLAVGQPSLDNQSHLPGNDSTVNLHTVRGDLMGDVAPNLGGFSHAGNVALQMFDARNGAGSFTGMQRVNPSPARPDYHQEHTFPSNGGHSTAGNVASNAVANKSRLDIMRETMRVMNG